MVTAQSTPARTSFVPRTTTAKSGMILPATIDQSTEFNMITTAMAIYYKQSGCLGSFDTALLVADAMRDSSAVVVLYVGLDGGQEVVSGTFCNLKMARQSGHRPPRSVGATNQIEGGHDGISTAYRHGDSNTIRPDR